MEKIKAPFTKEQVEKLNEYQEQGKFHPFTCCSPEEIKECLRAGKEIDGQYIEGASDGILIASKEGWICPCGKYKQDWAFSFMAGGG